MKEEKKKRKGKALCGSDDPKYSAQTHLYLSYCFAVDISLGRLTPQVKQNTYRSFFPNLFLGETSTLHKWFLSLASKREKHDAVLNSPRPSLLFTSPHFFQNLSIYAFPSYAKHLLQAMNGNTGIFKKGREVKIILRDRAYSSMSLEWQAARSQKIIERKNSFKTFAL